MVANRKTGELVPVSCRALKCGYCGPRLALGTASAIIDAKPERFLLLTLAGTRFDEVHGRMAKLSSALREHGTWETCWVLHENPRETGYHVHAVQHGTFVWLAALQEVATDQGMGKATIQRIRFVPPVARYLVKRPIDAITAPFPDAQIVMRDHLLLNGGRLVRSSGKFWRASDGRPIGGPALARRLAFELRARN